MGSPLKSPLKQKGDIIGNIANVRQANLSSPVNYGTLQRRKSVELSNGGKPSSNVSPSSSTVKCPKCHCQFPVRVQPPAGTFRAANSPRAASSSRNTNIADRAAPARAPARAPLPARPINKQSLQKPLGAASRGSTLRAMADKGQPIQEKDPANTSDLDVASRSKKDPQDTKGGTANGVKLNSPKVTTRKAANDEPPKQQLPKNEPPKRQLPKTSRTSQTEMKTKPSMIKGKESTSITSTQRTISLGKKPKRD